MKARPNLSDSLVEARPPKHLVASGGAVADSSLPSAIPEPVRWQIGRINGCGRRHHPPRGCGARREIPARLIPVASRLGL